MHLSVKTQIFELLIIKLQIYLLTYLHMEEDKNEDFETNLVDNIGGDEEVIEDGKSIDIILE